MAYNYVYVSKDEIKPYVKLVTNLIRNAQNELRFRYFTFQYKFNIGSYSRNMVAKEARGNYGFDADCNLMVNDDNNQYTPKQIKQLIMQALDKHCHQYGFDYCEDSTRVITIKIKDKLNSRIIFSCDLAIVNDYHDKYGNEHQEYIRCDKDQLGDKTYSWKQQPKSYYQSKELEIYLKKINAWSEVRGEYLIRKCKYGPNKPSREVYAETLRVVSSRYYA